MSYIIIGTGGTGRAVSSRLSELLELKTVSLIDVDEADCKTRSESETHLIGHSGSPYPFGTYFFWWSVGTTPSVLEKYPTNHRFYTAIGLIVGLSAFLASIPFAFFLSQSLAIPLIAAMFGGVLWVFLIFLLDRMILTSFRKDDTKKVSIILRFILTIASSLIISEPLLMRFFHKETALKMAQKSQIVSADARNKTIRLFQAKQGMLEKAKQEIQNRFDVLKVERDEKERSPFWSFLNYKHQLQARLC